MVQTFASKTQARVDVFGFEIGELGENLFTAQPGGQQIQNIAYPNSHATHAGPAAALVRVHGDSIR